jgi:deazaflavin-dependent oxidoreductase (nitroreductase family)
MGRYSAVRGRPLTSYEAAVERFAASRAGAWAFVRVFSPIDRRLLPITRGRVGMAIGAPVGVLETVGARSGRRRRTALLYVLDEDGVILVASNGGRAHDPGWLHNVRARSGVRFLTREHGWQRYTARVADGPERDRLWGRATDFYAGYRAYQARAGAREIPVVVLQRSGPVG